MIPRPCRQIQALTDSPVPRSIVSAYSSGVITRSSSFELYCNERVIRSSTEKWRSRGVLESGSAVIGADLEAAELYVLKKGTSAVFEYAIDQRRASLSPVGQRPASHWVEARIAWIDSLRDRSDSNVNRLFESISYVSGGRCELLTHLGYQMVRLFRSPGTPGILFFWCPYSNQGITVCVGRAFIAGTLVSCATIAARWLAGHGSDFKRMAALLNDVTPLQSLEYYRAVRREKHRQLYGRNIQNQVAGRPV